jgi:hypothetical protein
VLATGLAALLACSAARAEEFRWPLELRDWAHVGNYVDLDPGAGVLDYDCHATSYDGHRGTDIVIRDFQEQYEGRAVLAAAPGLVVLTDDGNFDEEVAQNGNPANCVWLQHPDGTLSIYYHLRKWSVGVYVGEQVVEGQPLGLVGSSGSSTDPHLHFEVHAANGSVLDPWAGACDVHPSLWMSQQQDVFDDTVALHDAGLSTVTPDNISIKYRPPDMRHVQQVPGGTWQYAWLKMTDLHPGDRVTFTWLRPDGTTLSSSGFTHAGSFASYGWGYWSRLLPAAGPSGTWTVQFAINGAVVKELPFVLDGVAMQPPVAVGRVVPVPRGIARDVLEGSDADGDIKQFHLVTPPTRGEVVLSGPRRREFAYTPVSGYQGADSFTFTVEDAEGNVSVPARLTLDVSPVIENALRLEGEEDHVAVPENGSLTLTSGFTIEAWIRRTTGSAGWQAVVDRRSATLGNSGGFHLFVQPDSRLRLGVGTGAGAIYVTGTTPIPMDRWTFVAATWNGALLRLFVGDAAGAAEDAAAVPFAGPISYSGVDGMLVGGSQLTGESLRGEIEEARIFNVARTAAVVTGDASCAFFEQPPPASMVARWPFQGDARDVSAFGNDGQLVNGASFVLTDSAFPSDCTVQDQDGDGRPDATDDCPLVADAAQADRDGDSVGDACDDCPDLRADQADRDADGVGDACDNCPALGNTDQRDADGDGAGDACDDCAGADADADGICDASDNCPVVSNPEQIDRDGDGIGDACDDDRDGDGGPNGSDCAPDDPRRGAAPAEATGLRVARLAPPAGRARLSWDDARPAWPFPLVADVVAGSLDELASDHGFARAACLAPAINGTGYIDADAAPSRRWYLVRWRDDCGVGSFGTASPPGNARAMLDAPGGPCP